MLWERCERFRRKMADLYQALAMWQMAQDCELQKKTSPTQAGFGYVRDSIVLRIDCEIDHMGNTR